MARRPQRPLGELVALALQDGPNSERALEELRQRLHLAPKVRTRLRTNAVPFDNLDVLHVEWMAITKTLSTVGKGLANGEPPSDDRIKGIAVRKAQQAANAFAAEFFGVPRDWIDLRPAIVRGCWALQSVLGRFPTDAEVWATLKADGRADLPEAAVAWAVHEEHHGRITAQSIDAGGPGNEPQAADDGLSRLMAAVPDDDDARTTRMHSSFDDEDDDGAVRFRKICIVQRVATEAGALRFAFEVYVRATGETAASLHRILLSDDSSPRFEALDRGGSFVWDDLARFQAAHGVEGLPEKWAAVHKLYLHDDRVISREMIGRAFRDVVEKLRPRLGKAFRDEGLSFCPAYATCKQNTLFHMFVFPGINRTPSLSLLSDAHLAFRRRRDGVRPAPPSAYASGLRLVWVTLDAALAELAAPDRSLVGTVLGSSAPALNRLVYDIGPPHLLVLPLPLPQRRLGDVSGDVPFDPHAVVARLVAMLRLAHARRGRQAPNTRT